VDADARDTAKIIEAAAGFARLHPAGAVMALMVLQYIPDSDHPEQIVSELMEAVPSGSFLVISDTTTDIGDGASRVASKINPRMGPTRLTPRRAPRSLRTSTASTWSSRGWWDAGVAGEANPHVVVNAFAGVARKP